MAGVEATRRHSGTGPGFIVTDVGVSRTAITEGRPPRNGAAEER